MFDAHVLNVLISAPGDTGEEVEAVKQSLHGFNSARAETDSIVLLPRHWKSDAVPRLGSEGAQGVINKQIVDKADIVVALFDSRLGQATPNAVSGTAEEIQRAVDDGKHVHVWFSNEDIPRGADREQLAALEAFRKELEGQGLLGQYADPQDLAYQVRQAIEDDIAELDLGPVQVRRRGAEHAMPRAQHDGDKRLFIENKSEVVRAEQLTWELEDDRMFKKRTYPPVDLPPLSHMDWWLLPLRRIDQIVITMRWTENGKAYEEKQTISV